MARYGASPLKHLSDHVLTEALARTPADHYVIWNGQTCPGRLGSVRSRALSLVEEAWSPLPLRTLIQRAARLSGCSGLDPETVRGAVRMHQSAGSAAYFLVRRTSAGDYLAVADVPRPSSGTSRLNAGDVVLDRSGTRFDESRGAAAGFTPARRRACSSPSPS